MSVRSACTPAWSSRWRARCGQSGSNSGAGWMWFRCSVRSAAAMRMSPDKNLSRAAGEVEVQGTEGEGDRVATLPNVAACQSDHPRPERSGWFASRPNRAGPLHGPTPHSGRGLLGVMAAYGFVSGLPLPLSGFTLRLWLSAGGVSLAVIGLTANIALAYSLKFLWAPLLDQTLPPGVLRRFGRR